MLYVLIAIMVLAWSGNFVVAKYALDELPPFALLFLRVLFSNALLLSIYLSSRQHRQKPVQRGDPSTSLRAGWRDFALLGLFGVAMNQTGFTVGLSQTTVAHSALIISLTPIFVLVLATRMKLESFTALKVVGMALSFTGVAVLVSEYGFGSNSPTFTGDLLTLGGSIAFALYTVYGKRVSERYDTLTFNTFTYLAGAVVVLPLTSWQLFDLDWQAVTWRGWLGVAYMAVIASVAAYMIFYYALARISASRLVAFSYLQPVLATLLALLLRGEKVTGHLLLGGVLVLLGVSLAERGLPSEARSR